MTFAPLAFLVVASLAAGIAVERVVRRRVPSEWLIVAVSAAFGAYFFSESFPESASLRVYITQWGPSWDGFYWLLGIVGAVVVALAADLGVRSASNRLSPT